MQATRRHKSHNRPQVGYPDPCDQQRARMVAALEATSWLVPLPTDANFVLFEVRPPFVAADVYAALRRRGVLTRYYASGRLRGCIDAVFTREYVIGLKP